MTSPKNRTGIIAAMESELRDLSKDLQHERTEKIAGREIHYGHLEDQLVAIVLCGCGKVNATLSATLLACHAKVSRILVTGISGGLAEGVKVGDIVIGDSFVQHDMDARPLFPHHEIPFEGFSVIESEPELRHLLALAARKMLASGRPPGLEESSVFEGLVTSGDQFLSSNKARSRVLEAIPRACCVDMESAAIAQVCRAADLPLGVMRVISDSADGSAHIDFAKFVEFSASKACAETVRHALRALAS
ncbi:MAG: 5'-methylthioadenosine/adenosylhomocysteine nucleosidase [Verrucomicrobia bacterium]|nr:MAG: 5'-methylthioadenosine/adenosylhomocysteine nucleosidase [Verrucomicrobiota bacterium]